MCVVLSAYFLFFIPRTYPDLALGPFVFFEDNPPFGPKSLMQIMLELEGFGWRDGLTGK